MADQKFLDLVRNYLWRHMLWIDNMGYNNSFEESSRSIKSDIHHALSGDYLDGLGETYKEKYARADEILEAHSAEVSVIIEELLLKMDKKKSRISINQISAQAILEPVMELSGFKYYIEYQKNGVRINVQLLPKKKAMLYLSYSKVHNEYDKLVDNILILKQMYEYFGVNSGIVNIARYEMDKFK